jgi:hypothetical protein
MHGMVSHERLEENKTHSALSSTLTSCMLCPISSSHSRPSPSSRDSHSSPPLSAPLLRFPPAHRVKGRATTATPRPLSPGKARARLILGQGTRRGTRREKETRVRGTGTEITRVQMQAICSAPSPAPTALRRRIHAIISVRRNMMQSLATHCGSAAVAAVGAKIKTTLRGEEQHSEAVAVATADCNTSTAS